jgi:hypothetical protein
MDGAGGRSPGSALGGPAAALAEMNVLLCAIGYRQKRGDGTRRAREPR